MCCKMAKKDGNHSKDTQKFQRGIPFEWAFVLISGTVLSLSDIFYIFLHFRHILRISLLVKVKEIL